MNKLNKLLNWLIITKISPMHHRINSLLNDHKAKKRTSLHSHSKYDHYYQGNRRMLSIRVRNCSHLSISSLISLHIRCSRRGIDLHKTLRDNWGKSSGKVRGRKGIRESSCILWARRRESQSQEKRSLMRDLRKYPLNTSLTIKKSLLTSQRKK